MSYIPSELTLTDGTNNTTSTIQQNIDGNLSITNPTNFGNIDFYAPNGYGKVRFNKSVNFSTYADFQGDLTLYANQAFQNNGREIFIDNNTNTFTEFKQDTAGVFQFSNNNGVVINSSTGLKLQSLTNANNYQLPTPDTLPLQNQIITFNSNGTSQFVNQSAPLTSSIFNYKASTPTFGVPASGYIEWDDPVQINPNPSNIRVSHLNRDGQDIDTLLELLNINDTIIIQDKNNSDNFQNWTIRATPVVVSNSYIDFPVTFFSGVYIFSNNHEIVLITSTGSSILALQQQVSTNTFDIGVLQTDVGTNTADIITNAGAISILQLQQITDSGNISTLQQQVSTNVLLGATVSTLSTGNAWNDIFIFPLVANKPYFINSLIFYNCSTSTNGLDFQLAFSNSTPLAGDLNFKAILQIDNNTSSNRPYILTTTNSTILSFIGANTNAPAGQLLSIDLIGMVLSTVSQNMSFQFRRTNTGNAAIVSVFKNSYYNILHNV